MEEVKTLCSPSTLEFKEPDELHELYKDILIHFDAYLEDPAWGESEIITFCLFLLKIPEYTDYVASLIFSHHERLMRADPSRFIKVLEGTVKNFLEIKDTDLPMEMTNVLYLVDEHFTGKEFTLLQSLRLILKVRPFYSAYLLQAQILDGFRGTAYKHNSQGGIVDDLHHRFKTAARMEVEGNSEWATYLDDDGKANFSQAEGLEDTMLDFNIHRMRAYQMLMFEERAEEGSNRQANWETIEKDFQTLFDTINPDQRSVIERHFSYWSSRFSGTWVREDLEMYKALFRRRIIPAEA